VVALTGGNVVMNWLLGFIPLPAVVSLPFGGSVLYAFVTGLLWVNIFWGIINLVPVYPLDGGSVTRNILLQVDPVDGVRKSLWISVVAGGIVALLGLVFFRSIFMALLFGFLAYQSYQSLHARY
jgi:stage IV sporulation protein FB